MVKVLCGHFCIACPRPLTRRYVHIEHVNIRRYKVKFFVPFADSEEQAESVIEATAKFIGNQVPSKNDLIYTVHYTHNGKAMVATVGEDVDPYYRESSPTVIAIFPPQYNGAPIKICLADRGVVRGEPILVSGDSQFITFEE
ncbi:hypothetical protein K6U70_00220 [Vibrio vulnificus]|nr:hypothetical protein [Vibrio vulnificus]